MTDWLSSDGWGTREQAIPGEWAMLVLIIVAGGAVGFLVLWFTMLRHERTVLHRARRSSTLRPELVGSGGVTALLRLEPVAEADDPGEADGDRDGGADGGEEAEAAAAAAAADVHEETDEEVDGELEDEPEPAAEAEPEQEPELEPEPEPERVSPVAFSGGSGASKGQSKLTEEILNRVEREIAGREGWRWKDIATLVRHEFGVSVHPSTIQRALKKRRRTGAAADPASA